MPSEDSSTSKIVAKSAKPLSQQRRKARHYGMQALYRWQMNGGTPVDIEAEFRTEYDFTDADTEYFRAILEGVIYHQPDIDAAFAGYLDRDIAEMTPVELALLRQAIFELRDRLDVPFKVVISEAVALARKFGATDGHKYINGVLDQAAATLRATEFQAH